VTTRTAARRAPAPIAIVSTTETNAFRLRLLEGLAASIRIRGFRDTTIADIVRHAGTSRRTFYEEFATKEDCYVALLRVSNETMRAQIATAVDPAVQWATQVRQAITAYADTVDSEPALMLSWIREAPALGATARALQREGMESLVTLLTELVDTDAARQAGVGPIPRYTAILLLGGLRELTAMVVEDGGAAHDLTEVAIAASLALLGAPARNLS
jgi:AcrR family transcriptional regulator